MTDQSDHPGDQPGDQPTDMEAFFAALGASHPGPGKYSPLDRYRDFRQIFLATDQGRRVLHEILTMGRMISSSLPVTGPIDADRVLANEGRRTLALDIFAAIHSEPAADRPVRANRKPGTKPERER